VYYARGTARQAKNDLKEALADYTKAIELDPGMAQAYANRAVIRTLQDQKADARQDFDVAFRLDPALRDTFKKFLERLK
jgi:tetratricopeptide (TPR) repeat protein